MTFPKELDFFISLPRRMLPAGNSILGDSVKQARGQRRGLISLWYNCFNVFKEYYFTLVFFSTSSIFIALTLSERPKRLMKPLASL